jgi:uncharacterized Zn-binding protein involved in type VI secretion
MFAMNTRHAIGFAMAAAALLTLGACAKQQEQPREIDWAKAALARNPQFELISTDEAAGTFNLRDVSNGRFVQVRMQDLVAGPAQPKLAVTPTPPAPVVQNVEEPPTPAETPAAPAEHAADQTTATVAAAHADGGVPLAEGPGYRISRGTPHPPATSIEGPGYRITRDEPASAEHPAARNAESVAANVEKRTDPIVCQGDRLMRIDGESIESTGDAVIAENGCDLYISNANIRAGGVGIIARQARVHIVNSTIGGSHASYEASEGAEIYVASSTFAGIGRRFDTAQMTDLGGNQYRTINR